LCWFSPDCKHFSKAKGSKPVDKNIRGLAWVAVRWAATVRPRVIMLENVEEFTTWGPLIDGRPDPKRKGKTFQAFVNALRRLSYQVEWRELRACDFGAPTIRKRLFLVARCDGRPIVWPEPTHGEPKSAAVRSGRLLPWRTAAEIIDWSLPCPSIFERERPLAENTLRRIARGIQRFVMDNPNPFVIRLNYPRSSQRERTADDPLQTITAKNDLALVAPHITKFRGGATGHPFTVPLHTITSGAGAKRPAGAAHALGLVTAFLTQHYTKTGVVIALITPYQRSRGRVTTLSSRVT
jgi:DNA (cytosine-5)-methyltransferase 1